MKLRKVIVKRVITAGILVCSFAISPCALALESQSAEVMVENVFIPDESGIEVTIPQIKKVKTNLVKQQETEIKENETYKEVFDYVYTTTRVNIRTYIGTESDILLTAETGTKLQRVGINAAIGWDLIKINNCDYYISNEYITTEEPDQLANSIEQQLEDSKISTSDLRYMSAIIWAEAGNQCEAGQQAVGIVVMNRVASDIYKDTVYDVINEPYQFTPVNNGSFSEALNYYDCGEMPECVVDAAKYALHGNTTVNYNGTTYDLDGYLCFSRYVENAKLIIQDHMFK